MTNRIIIISLISLLCMFGSCNQHKVTGKKPIICTSLVPIKYFAEYIAGNKWEVISIIPTNASHTNYEPTPKDMTNVANAKIYFTTGNIGFEDAWNQRFKEISKHCKFIDVSKNIVKIGSEYHAGIYEGTDPHFWLSPNEALIIAKNIYDAMLLIDPKNSSTYKENYMYLCELISKTDMELKEMLAPISGKTFLIYHPTLTYFAKSYNLNQIAIEENGKEPSASHIAEIIKIAKEKNIKVIFYQAQYTGPIVNNIAKEINAKTFCFDPLSYTWHDNMISIAQMLIDNQ